VPVLAADLAQDSLDSDESPHIVIGHRQRLLILGQVDADHRAAARDAGLWGALNRRLHVQWAGHDSGGAAKGNLQTGERSCG
jgi:hypothetical protein